MENLSGVWSLYVPTHGSCGGSLHASVPLLTSHGCPDVFNKQQGQRDEVQALIASTTACIVEQRLNAGDEHLVLASQGLWDVISPDDAALHLHFHLKVPLLTANTAQPPWRCMEIPGDAPAVMCGCIHVVGGACYAYGVLTGLKQIMRSDHERSLTGFLLCRV